MALTLAKCLVSNRCNQLPSLRLLKNVSAKNTKITRFAVAIKNYSMSIEPQIDKYIPISSRSLYKSLMEVNGRDGKGSDFENFAVHVESTISKENSNLLPELKFLYSALDPDMPSPSLELSTKEVTDRHFWFMHRLSSLLSSGGFEEVEGVREMMKGGVVGQGVVVDCNVDRFDVLRVWMLGGQRDTSTTPPTPPSLSDRLFTKPLLWRRPKRVVVVRRERGGQKVDVAMFRGVTHLSLLLPPTGTLKMHPTYKNILLTSSTLSLFFILSRPSLQWLLSTDHLGYAPVAFAGVFGGLSVLLWGVFKHAQKAHLEKVVGVLFDGVVAKNGGCLKMLVDKSQEELIKGVLLSYHFLNLNAKTQGGEKMSLGELEGRVEGWLMEETGGVVVRVPLEETVKWMGHHSLIHHDPLTHNLTLLPPSPHSHPSLATHLFHNPLSDATESTPISTTIKQSVQKIKETA